MAGIIVSAVGDELVIAHPSETLTTPQLIALAAGPALYLIGHVLFRLRMAGTLSRKRLVAAGAIGVCGVLGMALPALATAALILAVLVGLILVEFLSGPSHAAMLERVGAG